MKLLRIRKMADQRRLKQWQNELKELSGETGLSFDDICSYIGVSYNRDIGFYVKIPMKRRTLIGIGLAYEADLETINRWITQYGRKRRLYSKDISEDLIWIYLINRNLKDPGSFINSDNHDGTNYYRMYDECQQIAFETYLTVWADIISGSQDTSDLDEKLAEIGEGGDFEELKNFVINNIDSFKTAYAKPRKLLAKYCECILTTNGKATKTSGSDSLISLRGWLDDSMINYLSGSADTVNVTDNKTGNRTPDIKHVPKSRKAHIALALSLGMTRGEIDNYLELMGYLPLDEDNPDEQTLIVELDKWDDNHPLQRLYKDKYIIGDDKVELDDEDELQAVSDMLMLRQELRTQYKRRKLTFDYMKE